MNDPSKTTRISDIVAGGTAFLAVCTLVHAAGYFSFLDIDLVRFISFNELVPIALRTLLGMIGIGFFIILLSVDHAIFVTTIGVGNKYVRTPKQIKRLEFWMFVFFGSLCCMFLSWRGFAVLSVVLFYFIYDFRTTIMVNRESERRLLRYANAVLLIGLSFHYGQILAFTDVRAASCHPEKITLGKLSIEGAVISRSSDSAIVIDRKSKKVIYADHSGNVLAEKPIFDGNRPWPLSIVTKGEPFLLWPSCSK